MKRIHIQFSGSLQPDDASKILALLKEAIGRRPEGCGAYLRSQVIDKPTKEVPATILPIDDILFEE